ncbi:hypothetical protein ABIE66_004479 [Peribacillus sp. B2I2]|jgi:hypothetical protein
MHADKEAVELRITERKELVFNIDQIGHNILGDEGNE